MPMKIFRRGLITLLISGLLALTPNAQAGIKQPRNGFDKKLEKATFALYVKQYNDETVPRFTCTAIAYQKIKGGYLLLSAGHCIDNRDDAAFFVRTDVDDSLPFLPVTVVKYDFDKDNDFSILELDTKLSFPTIQLGSEDELAIGDKIENISFALGVAKQFNNGYVASEVLKDNDASKQSDKLLVGHFLVEVDGAGGSSGSAIVSKRSHHVVGVLTTGFPDAQIGMGIEPISKFYAFRADPKYVAHYPKVEHLDPFGFLSKRSALCCNLEVIGHIKLALQYVANGQSGQEACFTVDQMLGPSPIRLGDVPDTCQVEVGPTTLAIFHTHPVGTSPYPSRHDIDVANKFDLLMYVIQPPSLVEYNPNTKQTHFVTCNGQEYPK